MRRFRLLQYFILAATVLIATACAKNEANPETEEKAASSTFFNSKVDNQSFPTADIQFTSAKFIAATKMLQITGQPADRKESIILTLMAFGGKVATAADWKPGVYDFDPAHVANMEYLASAEYNKWNGNGYDQWFTAWAHVKTGSIKIETNNGTHIKGSFSFDAVRKNSDGLYNAGSIKKISEGSFDLDIK